MIIRRHQTDRTNIRGEKDDIDAKVECIRKYRSASGRLFPVSELVRTGGSASLGFRMIRTFLPLCAARRGKKDARSAVSGKKDSPETVSKEGGGSHESKGSYRKTSCKISYSVRYTLFTINISQYEGPIALIREGLARWVLGLCSSHPRILLVTYSFQISLDFEFLNYSITYSIPNPRFRLTGRFRMPHATAMPTPFPKANGPLKAAAAVVEEQGLIDPDALLLQLSSEEKIILTSGEDMWHTAPIPRLGIPRVRVSALNLPIDFLLIGIDE